MLSWEKPLVKPMAPWSTLHHISFRSTILVYYLFYFAIFTFQSIQQKYQKYLSYYLYQISLLQVSVKGLTTPLSCWLQVSWLFVQVLGNLHVVSYWIDTLVLKNWGKYLRYFVASPFPLQGRNHACLRGSKNDFWRRCWGGLRSSQDIPSTHHKLISLAFTLFAICLSFSSPPQIGRASCRERV